MDQDNGYAMSLFDVADSDTFRVEEPFLRIGPSGGRNQHEQRECRGATKSHLMISRLIRAARDGGSQDGVSVTIIDRKLRTRASVMGYLRFPESNSSIVRHSTGPDVRSSRGSAALSRNSSKVGAEPDNPELEWTAPRHREGMRYLVVHRLRRRLRGAATQLDVMWA